MKPNSKVVHKSITVRTYTIAVDNLSNSPNIIFVTNKEISLSLRKDFGLLYSFDAKKDYEEFLKFK